MGRGKGKELLYIRLNLRKPLSWIFLISLIFTSYTCRGVADSTAFLLGEANNSMQSGRLDSALVIAYSALDQYKVHQDTLGLIETYQIIGAIHDRLENRTSGRAHFRKALDLSQDVVYSTGIAKAYNNLGTSFYFDGYIDSAQYYYSRAYAIYLEMDDPQLLSDVLNNLGTVK